MANRAFLSAPGARLLPFRDQVVLLIRSRIVSGSLKPGDRLVEQHLARELGVGQNMIREALMELAHQGFVRRLANRGTYVTELSGEDAEKMAQVRGVLEALAIELICTRARQEALDWTPLESELDRMREAARVSDRELFYQHDLKFHRALWSLTGNEHLTAMLEQIVIPLFSFFIILYLRKPDAADSFLEAVAAHEKVLEAIRSGGVHAGSRAIRELTDLSQRTQQGLISYSQPGGQDQS